MSKKFRFRLASLLRMKQQRLEQHEGILRCLSLELQQARQKEADIEATIASEADSLKRGGRVELAAVMHAAAAWESRLADSTRQRQKAESNWRQANATYIALSNELAAMTKMHDRQFASHQQEYVRAEQKELDEVVLRKWIQQPGLLPSETTTDAPGPACDLTEIS